MPTQIEVRLTFDGPFNVGAGALGGSLADKPLTRDAWGLPVVPASAFKGRLRHEVERLTPFYYPGGPAPCHAPVAETMCQGEGPVCPVCTLFGSPWQPAKLLFTDLSLVEPEFLRTSPPLPGYLRPGVGLSRHLKVAEDHLLYTTEVFLPGTPLTMAGQIRGELDEQELKLLQAGLNSLIAVGGGKTRGLGWVSMTFEVKQETGSKTETAGVPVPAGETELGVIVRLESPLLLGTDATEAYYKTTRNYISGRVLRGALAQTMLAACDHPDRQPHDGCDFGRLFETASPPIFEDLQPATARNYPFPLPLTARSCKYHPGFKAAKESLDRGHGVGDILINQTVFEQMLANPAVRLPLLYQPHCPACEAEVAPFTHRSAVITRTGSGFEYDDVRVPVRRTSRTAIDRRRAVAADGQLYTLETIEPAGSRRRPVIFRGAVRGSPEQISLLRSWLGRIVAVGNGRSRGLGRIALELFRPEQLDEPLPPLPERLRDFNDKWQAEWRFYEAVAGAPPLPETTYYFSVTLLSAACLNWCGQPVTAPRPELLGFETGVELLRAFAEHQMIGGWHLGAGLPRRTKLAISRGSVFLYQSQGLSRETLLDRLANLEAAGLGSPVLRRQGFGRVLVCFPFHYQPEVTL